MRLVKAAMSGGLAAALAISAAAQTTTYAPPAQQSQSPAPKQSGGKVILSRSVDANGNTVQSGAGTEAAAATAGGHMATEPSAEDADRQAITYTDFDMDVRLRTAEQHLAVRALISVRNDSKTPLSHIPIQISSTLTWDRIRVDGKDIPFPVATLNSDTDHTGQLHEAAVPLSQPLAPGQNLQLDVTYSGAIAPNAQRLLAIGTPEDVALHSDWDRISVPFTGLRGFGNVVWYPVTTVPVILGDGARLFDEIGEHKLKLSGAHFRMRLTVEAPHGHAPSVALINGHPFGLALVSAGSQDVDGVSTANDGGSILGFEAPSLFVAVRTAKQATNTTIWVLPEDEAASLAWATATATVTPFLQGWLGKQPRSQLTLLDLPDAEDAPYETGALLATGIRPADADQLNGILAHALTHAWMQSPRAWLSEGVAHFMGTLWIEKQRGTEQAIGSLESNRAALSLAEPESPGQGVGQPLADAISPIYYRTKATYALWMLRSVAGDGTLSAALRAYDPTLDQTGTSKDAGSGTFEKLVEQAGNRRDLTWFFADWVDADKGLPDLSIVNVFQSVEPSGSVLVSVTVNNAGYAGAEVPVTVRSAGAAVTQRLLVPAHDKGTVRILIQEKPVSVQVNDGTVPETQASVHVTHLDRGAGSSSSQQGVPQK
jgi:hypothetical protein